MHTLDHLQELFRYNDWANRRVVVALKDGGTDRARRILAHLLTTEREYFERLYGKDSTGFDFWPDLSIAECGDLAKAVSARYEQLLSGFEEEGLDLTARYRTSAGERCSNTFRELLTHVLLHSSIHRGNIILNIRESGAEPPKTDYIVYLRETNAA